MSDASRAAEVINKAAEFNRNDLLLRGSELIFPNYGQLVMTGDLHGHTRNFERLQRYCDLEHFAARHVIIHEIIHEEVESFDGLDESFWVLIKAAQWKCDFPDQVHFLQSNHELAQLTGHEITKNGRIVTAAFDESIREAFGDEAENVIQAIHNYIRSLPLTGRTDNRVFLSHSLPSPQMYPSFDESVLTRIPTADDLQERGSVHSLVWGRYHSHDVLKELREILDTDIFICGHQPQETGYEVVHNQMIILASDHNHGVFLPFDLSKPTTIESLVKHIRPLASIE